MTATNFHGSEHYAVSSGTASAGDQCPQCDCSEHFAIRVTGHVPVYEFVNMLNTFIAKRGGANDLVHQEEDTFVLTGGFTCCHDQIAIPEPEDSDDL